MTSSGRNAEGRGRILATESNGTVAWRAIIRTNARLASVSASGGTNICRGGRNKTKGSVGGGSVPLKVRVKISWHEAEREAQERRRGACEKRDCAVARRLEVSITSLGGRGAIQMPSWSQMRLVGTKCCRRLETKSFIHCDSRCSSKKKQRLRGPLFGRVRTPCSSSNLARRGSFAAWIRCR